MRELALAAAPFVLAGRANAADLPTFKSPPEPILAPVVEQGWIFGLTGYVWGAGLTGRVRTLPPLPAANVNITFGDVLRNLDGGLMASGDARNGRFIIFTDLILSKISPGKGFSVLGYPGSVTLDSFSGIGLASAGYRAIDDGPVKLDLLAGVRGFAMSNTIKVRVGPIGLSYGKDQQWADAVVGARLRYTLSDKLFATAIGFVGAGASKYEWDTFGGLGYEINQSWSGFAGFRAMKVDYVNGNFVYDALQYGPVIGMHYAF
jgi:hypothetical protein